MVIFGAGASFDLDSRRIPTQASSASASEDRLPLAKQLFDPAFGKFAARYGPCKPLLSQMLAANGAVEQEFERLSHETVKHPHVANQLAAARYYIRDLIIDAEGRLRKTELDQTSNYINLLDNIERRRGPRGEHVCLVMATKSARELANQKAARAHGR